MSKTTTQLRIIDGRNYLLADSIISIREVGGILQFTLDGSVWQNAGGIIKDWIPSTEYLAKEPLVYSNIIYRVVSDYTSSLDINQDVIDGHLEIISGSGAEFNGDYITATVHNFSGAILTKGTIVRFGGGFNNGYMLVVVSNPTEGIPFGIVTADIPIDSTGKVLMRGKFQLDVPLPYFGVNKYKLYTDINGSFSFKQYHNINIGYTTENDDVVFVDFMSIQDDETKYTKYMIGDSSYNGGITNYSTMTVNQLEHIKLSNKNLWDKYSEYSKCVFWDFIHTSDNMPEFRGLRFDTINDILLFMQSNLVNGQDVVIKIYLKQYNEFKSTRIRGVNLLYSRLKCRFNYEKKGGSLQAYFNFYDTCSENDLHRNLIRAIYQEFLGVNVVTPNANHYSTVGFSNNIANMYSLVPTKAAKGVAKITGLSYDARFRKVTDNSGVVFQDWTTLHEDSFLCLHSSNVFSTQGALTTFSTYGETPSTNEPYFGKTSVRIYRYVDDINNPTINYFVIKPLGIDTFFTSFSGDYLNADFNNIRLYIKSKNSKKNVKITRLAIGSTVISDIASATRFNVTFRFQKYQVTEKVIKQKRSTGSAGNETLEFFLVDENTGLSSDFQAPLEIKRLSNGCRFKIGYKAE